MYKPKIFIGSSSEGLNLAETIKAKLEDITDCSIWNEVKPQSNQTTLEWIVENSENGYFDFAIIVFTADDKTESRGQEKFAPRDNVLFELGLFMGTLGRDNIFIVYNRKEDIKIPSDLLSAHDYGFDSVTPISKIDLSELKNNYNLKISCDEIRNRVKDYKKPIPQEKLLKRELGALYRIINAFTTPTFPHIDSKFLKDLNYQSSGDERFRDIHEVVNFAKTLIDDFLKPYFFPEEYVRVYFAYFLGDGIEIGGNKIYRCTDIRRKKDGSWEKFDGSFVVGFSDYNNYSYTHDHTQDKWLFGNVLSCYRSGTTESLSNCASGFNIPSIKGNLIKDTENLGKDENNHYVEDEKSVLSVPVLFGANQTHRYLASLGVLAISHSKKNAINENLQEKAMALSIVLGYIFKLYAKNIDFNVISDDEIPNFIYGISDNSDLQFKKRVVLIRRNMAQYFERKFIENNTHRLKIEQGVQKLYTDRAINWRRK